MRIRPPLALADMPQTLDTRGVQVCRRREGSPRGRNLALWCFMLSLQDAMHDFDTLLPRMVDVVLVLSQAMQPSAQPSCTNLDAVPGVMRVDLQSVCHKNGTRSRV